MDIYEAPSLDLVFVKVAKQHHNVVHALLSGKEVYPGQPPLLRALAERDGQSQKELAEKLQITPATLTVMLSRMEKAGLVIRKQDEADQRISRVFLTEKGRQAHLEVKEVLEGMDALCFHGFTPEEKIIFRRLLLAMYENLRRADQQDGSNCRRQLGD
jgi:DNA-binding MarR family transcriptional regulator